MKLGTSVAAGIGIMIAACRGRSRLWSRSRASGSSWALPQGRTFWCKRSPGRISANVGAEMKLGTSVAAGIGIMIAAFRYLPPAGH
jgi:hypothetical protein